jgi:cell division septum initiation protein DivIVA
LADQAEASKAQNVEVKAVEKADPRLAAAKVLNEQVQRNQEVAQVSRDKQASSAQLKILITSNADKLKQSLQESSELAKDTSRKPVPPSPVGQRIDIKA